MGSPSAPERIRPASARVKALLLDAGALGYTAWAADTLLRGVDAPALFARFPLLPLCALPLAVLWQVSDASLGQRAWSLERRASDRAKPAGHAPLRRVAWAGVLALIEVAAVLTPMLLLGLSLAGVLTSLSMVVCLWALAAADALERSPAERLAGLRTVVVPPAREAPKPWWRRPNAWVVLGLFVLTLAVGVRTTQLDLGALISGGEKTATMWRRLTDPDWSITSKVVGLMIETVFVALTASLLALPFAFVLGFLAARNVLGASWGGRLGHAAVRALLNVTRSMEPLIWATIFTLWVGVGPFAGMLALCVHSIASLAKLYSEALEGIDPGPVEAVRSTGARTLPVLRYGMLPQVLPAFLSFTFYRWDINVRMATILGLVGGGGIGGLLIEAQQLGAYAKMGTIIFFITLVVWSMDSLSSRLRRKVG